MATTQSAPSRRIKPADHPPLLAGERGPAAISRPGLHETVLKVLSALPRGRVLDCPTGEGALAEKLVAAGFDVRACDLYDELFRLDGVEIKKGDLSGTLPYATSRSITSPRWTAWNISIRRPMPSASIAGC